jgi:hypothetical protein
VAYVVAARETDVLVAELGRGHTDDAWFDVEDVTRGQTDGQDAERKTCPVPSYGRDRPLQVDTVGIGAAIYVARLPARKRARTTPKLGDWTGTWCG